MKPLTPMLALFESHFGEKLVAQSVLPSKCSGDVAAGWHVEVCFR